MEFTQKAVIRIEHWMEHNQGHQREYDEFARQLEQADAGESAAHIREMAELTRQSSECLRRALAALGSAQE